MADIFFVEDVAAALAARTPLLDAGLALRARDKGEDEDDVTVKLRPGRHSQLVEGWLAVTKGDGWEVKVEADWAGSARVLAVSFIARPECPLESVYRGERPVSDLFTPAQRRFLRDCAGVRINLAALTMLPPVTAVRWKARKIETTIGQLSVRAERWTVGELDFLELSLVVELDGSARREDVQKAAAAQVALTGYLRSMGFEIPTGQETKTTQVLQHAVTAWQASA